MFDAIIFGAWFILGIVHLFAPGEITKFSYGCCWGVLMLELAERIVV
jgi:hypothetical protein